MTQKEHIDPDRLVPLLSNGIGRELSLHCSTGKERLKVRNELIGELFERSFNDRRRDGNNSLEELFMEEFERDARDLKNVLDEVINKKRDADKKAIKTALAMAFLEDVVIEQMEKENGCDDTAAMFSEIIRLCVFKGSVASSKGDASSFAEKENGERDFKRVIGQLKAELL